MGGGGEAADLLILLLTDEAVRHFTRAADALEKVRLGETVSMAAGPMAAEELKPLLVASGTMPGCLAYAHSRGHFTGYVHGGESLVGRVAENAEYYRTEGVTAAAILSGGVPRPADDDARALYEVLDRWPDQQAWSREHSYSSLVGSLW